MIFKQSTITNYQFFMVDSTDSISGKTGLTPVVTLSKDGAAFGAAAGAITEVGLGWYNVALTIVDTGTLGSLTLHATATGADPCDPPVNQVCLDLPGATVSSVTGNVAGSVASVVGNVGGNVVGSVASVTAGVTLAASAVQAIWNALTSALTTTGSIGKLLVTNVDAAISSRLATSGYTVPPTAAAIATAVWDALTSALTTIGSIGLRLATDIDAAISTRLASGSYTAPDNSGIAAIKAKTDNLPAAPASEGNVTAVGNAVVAVGNAVVSVSDQVTAVQTTADAIQVQTDNLPPNPAAVIFKINTAYPNFVFPMQDSNGNPVTGLTVTAIRTIDGAATAACANAPTEVGNGFYKISLAASDLNGNNIAFLFTGAGAVPLKFSGMTEA